MPGAVEPIGTGETYTEPQGWEDALNGAHAHRGECKAEVFSNVNFAGVTYTSTNFPTLTSGDGAEHDGRAHEVSGAGNARIEFTGAFDIVSIKDEFIVVSWLEVKGPGNNNNDCFDASTGGNSFSMHHDIIHNNDASTGVSQDGIIASAGGVMLYYRNIFYGFGGSGIFTVSAGVGSAFLLNTIYEGVNGDSVSDGGINVSSGEVKSNASLDNLQNDILGTGGTQSNNATSDATATEGTNNLINQVAADTFVNATTTFANTDLLLKAGSNLIDAGETTFSTATYPEIDESIDNRGVPITGTWDIGAHQFVAGAPSGAIPLLTSGMGSNMGSSANLMTG